MATIAAMAYGLVLGAGLVFTTLYSAGFFSSRVTTETTTETSTIFGTETITATSFLTTTSFPQYVQVSVNAVNISHSLPELGLSASCSTSRTANGFISVQNTGTVSVSLRDLTIVPSGRQGVTIGLSEVECLVPSESSLFVSITSLPTNWGNLTLGEPYIGYLTLSDDTLIQFMGTFS